MVKSCGLKQSIYHHCHQILARERGVYLQKEEEKELVRRRNVELREEVYNQCLNKVSRSLANFVRRLDTIKMVASGGNLQMSLWRILSRKTMRGMQIMKLEMEDLM
ncbi:hypothetical protein ACS0TY_014799 [Phlomoides rotata]